MHTLVQRSVVTELLERGERESTRRDIALNYSREKEERGEWLTICGSEPQISNIPMAHLSVVRHW
jgi:hypothetical protein